jgi:carbamate kinase
MAGFALIAVGGNSLIKDAQHMSVRDQYRAVCETAVHIVDIIDEGYDIVLTHGNGPQVGFILRRSELAFELAGMHIVPLVSCVADTQGAIGYQLQQALNNEFRKRSVLGCAVTVVTQVEVDRDDPAFLNPTKPIGSFYSEAQMDGIKKKHPDWHMICDAGRGYRRVVPSPAPKKILEEDVIQFLVRQGFCVIGAGGGGIPVFKNKQDEYEGVDAVIDKDSASSLLASDLKADLFIISTSVEKVSLNYGTPDEKPLDSMSLDQAKRYTEEGHFAPGSMLPKIEAALKFIERGGKKAIITSPESLVRAIRGETGTSIYPG